MKRTFCLFFALLICALAPISVHAGEEAPTGLSAKAYALCEIDTGRLICSHKGDVKLPMASTTKIMTALLAIESGRLNEIITVTAEDVKVEGSSLSLREGDRMTLSDMIRGMMTVSGNDAAKTIARFVGGSEKAFIGMMNARAAELMMESTHFNNPHGLPDDDHYTTAEDMLKLTCAALKEPLFADIVSHYKNEIPYINSVLGYTTRTLKNTNQLLNTVDGCVGVKTGYTKAAGRCLVSAVRREGTGVICVVLNCPNYWADSTSLLEYGMTQVVYGDIITDTVEYELNVVGGVSGTVRVQNTRFLSGSMLKKDYESMYISVVLPRFVYAPVKEGDNVGRIDVYFGGELFESIPIIAMENVQKISYFEGLSVNFEDMLLRNLRWLFE